MNDQKHIIYANLEGSLHSMFISISTKYDKETPFILDIIQEYGTPEAAIEIKLTIDEVNNIINMFKDILTRLEA